MKLSKVLLLPITIPVVLYVGFRLIRAKGGAEAVAFIRQCGKEFDARMLRLDQLLPPGSYSHKKAVRDLRDNFRKYIKEAYVKKS